MNIKDIKVGETYNVQLQFREIDPDGNLWISEADEGNIIKLTFDGAYISTRHMLFSNDLISPLPKYDPCRRFKKGDKVRVVEWHGRTSARDGMFGFVVKNEENGGMVELAIDGWDNGVFYHACKLELVTPVEELEPYHLNEIYDIDDEKLIGYEVARGDMRDTIFYGGEGHLRTIEQAKEAAEAECARLNAEWRKEQENV